MATATLIQPSGEMWQKIRVELNEDVRTRDKDVAAIKDWMRKQPHLPNDWDSERIMTFLRGSSFSLEKCKRKLDMYFTMRSACPEFFTNRDINRPELQDLMSRAQGPPLPGLTPNGRRVTICRGLDKNLDTNQMNEAFKVAMMIGDVRLKEESEGVAGDVYILDASIVAPSHLGKISPSAVKKFLICVQVRFLFCEAFKVAMMNGDVRQKEESEGVAGDVYILDASIVAPSHLGKISPSAVKKFLICVQEAYPVKLKQVHVVNASPIIDTVVGLVKPFLKEKIRKRIFIHTEMKTLYEHVPREMLPAEYGGDCGSIDDINAAWMKKLSDYAPWFAAQESLRANESLRPGRPTNYDELFGIDGSFRQLSID